jgi:hypothetical protein
MAVSRISNQSIQQSFPKGNTIWDGTTNTSAFDSLGVVVLNTAQSTITFSNIPATYTHLQIRGIANGTSSASEIGLRFNGDSATNYVSHRFVGTGSGTPNADPGAYANTSADGLTYVMPSSGSTFGSVIFDILDYTNTNKYKTVRHIGGWDANGSGQIALLSDVWLNTSAISSIIVRGTSSNFSQYSSFALYGIK